MIILSYGHIITSYDHMTIRSYGHMIDQKSENLLGFKVERWNVGDRLKRVLAKFQANRSYPQGVNGRSKIAKKSQKIDFLGVEKWNVGDRPKRVLAKFEADRSHVWGVNGRSKVVGYGAGPDFRNLQIPGFVGYGVEVCRLNNLQLVKAWHLKTTKNLRKHRNMILSRTNPQQITKYSRKIAKIANR